MRESSSHCSRNYERRVWLTYDLTSMNILNFCSVRLMLSRWKKLTSISSTCSVQKMQSTCAVQSLATGNPDLPRSDAR